MNYRPLLLFARFSIYFPNHLSLLIPIFCMKQYLLFASLLLSVSFAFAQQKTKPVLTKGAPVSTGNIRLAPLKGEKTNSFENLGAQPIQTLHFSPVNNGLSVAATDEAGQPTFIRGSIKNAVNNSEQQTLYLRAMGSLLNIENPETAFSVLKTTTDELGQTHIRLQQKHNGIEVYAAELTLHSQNGIFTLANGRTIPTPKKLNTTPTLSENDAQTIAISHLTNGSQKKLQAMNAEQLKLVGGKQFASKLVIYHPRLWDDAADKTTHLAYAMEISLSPLKRFDVFIDAATGEVLRSTSKVCDFNGPVTATATDLKGATVTINTYLLGSTYYMLDASRTMFNLGQSNLPNDPVGGIQTLNANNTSSSNISYNQITSTNNTWGSPTAVSAHNNGALAYVYYKNTFNRNSIDGNGGSIYSLINVADDGGASMENAYWNGQAMFYGNGGSNFFPLAKGLDVAGHEMTHGVVQSTANLEYQGQSGALNESFADIFGAMIDRDDWKVGEDVCRPGAFTTGALRDLSNPHNGGASLNDRGWQPAHYNERYTGTQDNGGVHINSGIPNYAYYIFANNGAVGKVKAEQVFYRALSVYLQRSSQFKDLRTSVLQSIADLYGASAPEIAIAASAFDQVGITGPATPPAGGGSTAGGNYQTDLQTNPGADWVVYKSTTNNLLYVVSVSANGTVGTPQVISSVGANSRPSVSDNGTSIVFVGTDNKIYEIAINWSTGAISENALSSATNWRNVVVSKDANRVAALTTANDNTVFVYDFPTNTSRTFTLYNPTTATGSVTNGGVQYADAMDFDYSGEKLMYDSYNIIPNTTGGNIDYWDIGFIKVWNKTSNTFGDGTVEKLFNSIPANTSVGDPVFSKNSPYIIGFDFIDNRGTSPAYSVLGVNVQSGDNGSLVANDAVGYPCYSRSDNKVLFNTLSNTGSNDAIGIVATTNKITGSGNPAYFLNNATWGVWFANGARNLNVSTVNPKEAPNSALNIFPNPTNGKIFLSINTVGSERAATISLFDMTGRMVVSQKNDLSIGGNLLTIDASGLPRGNYAIMVQTSERTFAQKVMIME